MKLSIANIVHNATSINANIQFSIKAMNNPAKTVDIFWIRRDKPSFKRLCNIEALQESLAPTEPLRLSNKRRKFRKVVYNFE